jgi:predicted dehydrogenase
MKIGIVGCGKQSEKHISGLIENGINDIVICDLDVDAATKLAEKFPNVTGVCADFDELISKGVSAIIIATPTSSHFTLVKASIENNIPFLVEKPLTATSKEAFELAELSEKANIPGMVGFIYRQAPVFQRCKSILEGAEGEGSKSNTLGKITSAYLRIGGRGSHQVWKHKKASNGGAISEMLVHMADMAVWYFGDFQDAEILRNELRQPERMIQGSMQSCDAEDYVLAEFQSQSGLKILIQADMISPAFTQYIEIQGENGTLEASIQSNRPNYLHLIAERNGYAANRTDLSEPGSNLYISQGRDIINMIKTGKLPANATSLRQAASAMETIESLG